MKRVALLATSGLLVACSMRPATLTERLKATLDVGCQVTEKEQSASPYVNGSLAWEVTVKLANTGREGLKLGDDMILMDSNSAGEYVGAYAVYHPKGTSGGAWGQDYYDRAHNYAIANFSQYWPDGSMMGYSDGGTHHMGTPPDYKAPKSACNSLLAPGQKTEFSVPMLQGVWLKREQSARLVLALPEIESTADTQSRSRCRIILTLRRSERAKNAWEVRGKTIVPLEAEGLKRLLVGSVADEAMRVLALNWLADVDKGAAAPSILQTIRQAKPSDDWVASVQLLGYHGISPDAEALRAIKTMASGQQSWSQKAAARYVKDKTGAAGPKAD
jgi:hypothetical protein